MDCSVVELMIAWHEQHGNLPAAELFHHVGVDVYIASKNKQVSFCAAESRYTYEIRKPPIEVFQMQI